MKIISLTVPMDYNALTRASDMLHGLAIDLKHEGGEPEAWREPPHYDPEALRGGRIILAAFTTSEAPAGRVRVARLHVEASGDAVARAVIASVVAATEGGEKIELDVECIPFGEKR